MIVEYKNSETRKLCTDIRYAKRKLNVDAANKIAAAVNFIESADSFADIVNYPPFHFHELTRDRKNQYSIDAGRRLGYRIIINPLDKDRNSLAGNLIENIKECASIVIILEVTNHYD